MTLARALGFGVNSEGAFEASCTGTACEGDDEAPGFVIIIESMLFGQAGFLEGDAAGSIDGYVRRLAERKYRFLSNKFGLRPCADMGWKLSGCAPEFPAPAYGCAGGLCAWRV